MTHRPLVSLTLAFTAGLIIEKNDVFPGWWGAVVLFVCLILALRWCFWQRVVIGMVALVCGVLAYRAHTSLPAAHYHFAAAVHSSKEVSVIARVVSVPETGKVFGKAGRMSFIIDVERLDNRPVTGQAQADVYNIKDIRYGDRYLLQGRFTAPQSFGNNPRLSGRDTLARKNIFWSFQVKKKGRLELLARAQGSGLFSAALFCRAGINGVFERYLSAGEAGLMKALVTGERRGIPAHVNEIFRRSGTSHIVAVSGLNIGMVAAGIYFVLALLPVPRITRLLSCIVLIAWYALLAGGSAPVVRAALMSSLYIGAMIIEREQDTLNTLAGSALLILVADPSRCFDISFQLSFAGVLSLVLMAPVVAGLWQGQGWLRIFHEYIGVSVAAFFGTAGITAYYFGTLTPAGIFANIPAVPLVGIITLLGGVLLVLSPVAPLATLVACVLKAALNLLVYLLYLFTLVPNGMLELDPFPGLKDVLGYYVVMGILIWWAGQKCKNIADWWSVAS